MMKGLKSVVWKLLNILGIGGAVNLHLQSGLKEDGWFLSFRKQQSIDKDSLPIPWLTYPFIKFLEPRLSSQMSLYEFGCGNSTLWYSARVREVKAVEHDKKWHQTISQSLPDNASVALKKLEDGNAYEASIITQEQAFDVIIIDGKKRNECVEFAFQALHPHGVIILDNSERNEYQPAKEMLEAKGFKRLDFFGPTPIVAITSCTSVFYRTNNCFNI
ncbi:FkbM family methyltransferase [marine bacterium AO1-C]|nr:FkbM family methyltransferase [marine bacterium AO1-C]